MGYKYWVCVSNYSQKAMLQFHHSLKQRGPLTPTSDLLTFFSLIPPFYFPLYLSIPPLSVSLPSLSLSCTPILSPPSVFLGLFRSLPPSLFRLSAAVIGTRLHHAVAITCLTMALYLVSLK